MRNETEAGRAVEKYADTVRRICFMHLNNRSDVEDVFQDVFLKYALHDEAFESDAHEKAWLICVTINRCKDTIKNFYRRMKVSFEDITTEPSYIPEEEHSEVLEAVLSLPAKYRDVIYLFYYEGYTAVEIAGILRKSENTVYTWLSRAKSKLKDLLGGESFDRQNS